MARKTGADQLTAWLDDAYAMENGLIGILRNHAAQFGDELPSVARRLERHIVETQQHAQRLQECLRLMGTSPSAVKSTFSSVMGTIEGATTAVFRDQLMKDALADYASEQFEVACYTALIGAAIRQGQREVAALCRQNLDEDLAMATWLLQNIGAVVAHEDGAVLARR
jgi:ferritin-like metal-binding protein YciE